MESRQRIRLLLVEDDEDDAFLAVDELKTVDRSTFDVCWESEPRRALDRLVEEVFDVCVLDYRLGEMTGLELIEAARSRGIDLPFILLTGHDDRWVDEEAMRAGASDYLVKTHLSGTVFERAIRYSIDRARSTKSLQSSERRFRSVVESASEGILVANEEGRLLSSNQSALAMFERSTPPSTIGELFTEMASFPTMQEFVESDDATTRSVSGATFEFTRAFGSRSATFEATFTCWQDVDHPMWTVLVRDVTERRTLKNQLLHQATHDSLTGLANRKLFADRVEAAVAKSVSTGHQVVVVFLDLDDFKEINDTVGHQSGDDVLKQAARRLLTCLRTGDLGARLGGDEFAILIDGESYGANLNDIGERMLRGFAEPIIVAGRSVSITASIGLASSSRGAVSARELLRNADLAMYAAKDGGKDCFRLFEDQMFAHLVDRLALQADLAKALTAGPLGLHYQPVVELASQRIVGFEALLRWWHPSRGLQEAPALVRLADETGLLGELGRSVLREALQTFAGWRTQHPAASVISLAVNVTTYEFNDPTFVDFLTDLSRSLDIPALSVVLKITESAMANTAAMRQRMQMLSAAGFRLAVDDFGTGYSSLSYLQDLPISVVKVDRSFIGRLGQDSRTRDLLQAILGISTSMGLETVAEGIEKESEMEILRDMGFRFGQGYLFGHACPAGSGPQNTCRCTAMTGPSRPDRT